MPNPTLLWHGVAAGGERQRLLLRVGDCSWQNIPHAHTWGSPGYPLLLARALLADGTAMRFANYHAGTAASLPGTDALERACGGGRPDAIVVEFGSYYAGRGLIRSSVIKPYELRTWFNWMSGSLGGALHRVLSRPLLRRWGRHRSEPASELGAGSELALFLDGLRAHYPGVPVVYLPPHRVDVDAAVDPARIEDAAAVLIDGARRGGAAILDCRAELAEASAGGREMFAANGYDLRLAAHEVLAGRMLRWLQAEWRGAGSQLQSSNQIRVPEALSMPQARAS